MFQQAQVKIQRIGATGMTLEEEKIRKNVQSALVAEIQQLSSQFRSMQKDYLQSKCDEKKKKKTTFHFEEKV